MTANELTDDLESHLFAIGKERPFYEHAIMLRQLQAENEALKDDKLKYAEAVVEALEWGSYAGDYFQQKHGWHEDVAKWNDIVSILRKAQENPLQDKLDAIANKVVFGKAQEK